MPNTKKLVDLEIEETSGVDPPAHLYEGWLVRKDSAAVLDEVLTEVRDESQTTDQGVEPVDLTPTMDAPAEEVVIDEPEVVIEPAPVLKTDDSPSESVTKELADLRKAFDDVTAEAASLREEREMEKATERVSAWRILPGVVAADFAPVLRSLRGADPEAAHFRAIRGPAPARLRGRLRATHLPAPVSEHDGRTGGKSHRSAPSHHRLNEEPT